MARTFRPRRVSGTSTHRFVALLAFAWLTTTLTACGPTHRHTAFKQIGEPLHLVVRIAQKHAPTASGTLYYQFNQTPRDSSPAESDNLPLDRTELNFQPHLLERQGQDLVATLPTTTLEPGESVAYYFALQVNAKPRSLGSPAAPYRTTFVSREELVQRALQFKVTHGHAYEPLAFHLTAGPYAVENPVVFYTPPDLHGQITQYLDFDATQDQWTAEVTADRVAPGRWSYRIEADVDGQFISQPSLDESEEAVYFIVEPAPSPVP